MNWQFILCNPLVVVLGFVVAIGDEGEGGVARSDNDADNS
jgi:hypothetical protein